MKSKTNRRTTHLNITDYFTTIYILKIFFIQTYRKRHLIEFISNLPEFF